MTGVWLSVTLVMVFIVVTWVRLFQKRLPSQSVGSSSLGDDAYDAEMEAILAASLVADPGTADGTRAAMRKAYMRHAEAYRSGEAPSLPQGTSFHDAGLYGALASRYAASSGKEPGPKMEQLIWLELLPFVHLPVGLGVEGLAEYVVWKEEETTQEANKDFLKDAVSQGLKIANSAGRRDDVKSAMRLPLTDGQVGYIPWAELFMKDG